MNKRIRVPLRCVARRQQGHTQPETEGIVNTFPLLVVALVAATLLALVAFGVLP